MCIRDRIVGSSGNDICFLALIFIFCCLGGFWGEKFCFLRTSFRFSIPDFLVFAGIFFLYVSSGGRFSFFPAQTFGSSGPDNLVFFWEAIVLVLFFWE